VLLHELPLLIRILRVAGVVMVGDGGAAGERQRGGGEGEESVHVHSWIGFAFSLTLPSTTSTRKPTALTWYRSRTRSLCLATIIESCSIVMLDILPSFTCSFSISLYSLRISSPFEPGVTFTTYGSACGDVTDGRDGGGGGAAVLSSAALRRRKSSGPS